MLDTQLPAWLALPTHQQNLSEGIMGESILKFSVTAALEDGQTVDADQLQAHSSLRQTLEEHSNQTLPVCP